MIDKFTVQKQYTIRVCNNAKLSCLAMLTKQNKSETHVRRSHGIRLI